MAIEPFLAMTAAEIQGNSVLPPKTAWMACHFSPYGLGLSNLPRTLPPGSLLIVDDITPIHGHDPQVIRRQLYDCAADLCCSGILLDFQRPGVEEAGNLACLLAEALPFPVAVSHWYADGCGCAVCLPPVPPSEPPEAYLAPWQDREIWLELALDAAEITVTEAGSHVLPLPSAAAAEPEFFDRDLLCRYHCHIGEDSVRFTLRRAAEDLAPLLSGVERSGVTQAVGLYQEFYGRRYAQKDSLV